MPELPLDRTNTISPEVTQDFPDNPGHAAAFADGLELFTALGQFVPSVDRETLIEGATDDLYKGITPQMSVAAIRRLALRLGWKLVYKGGLCVWGLPVAKATILGFVAGEGAAVKLTELFPICGEPLVHTTLMFLAMATCIGAELTTIFRRKA